MNYLPKTKTYILRAVVIIIAISVVLTILLLVTGPEPVVQSRIPKPVKVDVYKVRYHNLIPKVQLVGRIRPAQKAKLRFEVSGRILQRFIEPGQTVKYSSILMTLDSGDFENAVAEAKAQHTLESASIQRDKKLLALAKDNTALQVKEVKRLNRLGKGALVSQSRLGEVRQRLYQLRAEEARLNFSVETASARIVLKKAALERAMRNLKRTELRAPFAGVVNLVTAQKGDLVSTNNSIVELVSSDEVELYLQVRNQVAMSLALGMKVEVLINQKKVQGSIIALQADPDSSTFTHALRIKLPKGSAVAGMLANVNLQLRPLDHVIAVPINSIFRKRGAAYVMLVDDDQMVKRQAIHLGQRVGEFIVVSGGLSDGDLIVRGDLSTIKSEQKVSIKKKKSNKEISKH